MRKVERDGMGREIMEIETGRERDGKRDNGDRDR